jgi:hypothetical protein
MNTQMRFAMCLGDCWIIPSSHNPPPTTFHSLFPRYFSRTSKRLSCCIRMRLPSTIFTNYQIILFYLSRIFRHSTLPNHIIPNIWSLHMNFTNPNFFFQSYPPPSIFYTVTPYPSIPHFLDILPQTPIGLLAVSG